MTSIPSVELLQSLWVGLESSDLHYFCYRNFYLLADVIWISGTIGSRAEQVFSSLAKEAPCTCSIFSESGLWVVRQKSMCKSQVFVPEGSQGHSSFIQATFLLGAWPSHSVCIWQWHLWSSTAPGSPGWSSQCRVLWIGVYPVTLCGWEWTSYWTWYFGALGFLPLISISNLSSCLSCASTYTILFSVIHCCIGTSGEIRTPILFSSLGQIVWLYCWVKNCSQWDTEFYWEIIAFSSKNYPIANREFTYNSEDTETTGEEEQAFLVSRYFVIITLCKNEELTWIYFVPPPLTYPHVFFWCLGNGLCRWKSSFSLLAISDWNHSQSAISFLPFFSKLTSIFSLHPEQNKTNLLIPDMQLMLLKWARPMSYLPWQLLA